MFGFLFFFSRVLWDVGKVGLGLGIGSELVLCCVLEVLEVVVGCGWFGEWMVEWSWGLRLEVE